MSESITIYDFVPELLGVFAGTMIGYLLANRASKMTSMKNVKLTKSSLLDEIKHNQTAIKKLTGDDDALTNKDHISRPFRKAAYSTAIASGDFAKLEHGIQHVLGELYHEMDAFEVYTETIENWLYATIALQPEKQEAYSKFMRKTAKSDQYLHFIRKMSDLLSEAESELST